MRPLSFIPNCLSTLLSGLIFFSANASAQADPCVSIREQIQTQTGLEVTADAILLQKIAANPGCQFSSAEVYRAAYGDKPRPKAEPRRYREKNRHDDDDD